MTKQAMIEYVVLALRPGEWAHYSEDEPELPPEQYYAVALLEMPEPHGEAHPEGRGLTVVAMQRYKTIIGERCGEVLWGGVHLTADTKQQIGGDLLSSGAVPGCWYYLSPSYQEVTDA